MIFHLMCSLWNVLHCYDIILQFPVIVTFLTMPKIMQVQGMDMPEAYHSNVVWPSLHWVIARINCIFGISLEPSTLAQLGSVHKQMVL